METACYSFRMEWLDPFAELRRPYKLKFHQRMDKRHKIELFDIRTRKTFLKPTEYPSIQLEDLFIGARVNIFGRQMTVIDYEDAFTKRALEPKRQRCLAVLGVSVLSHLGEIWGIINESGLKIVHLRMCSLTRQDALKLFDSEDSRLYSEPIVILEIVGEHAVSIWHETIPSLESSGVKGLIKEAESPDEAERVLETCFGHGHKGHAPDMNPPVTAFGGTGPATIPHQSKAVDAPSVITPTARMDDKSSCAVILPHIILSNNAGPCISDFLHALENDSGGSRLQVTAMQLFELDLVTAEEFLEVYKHVAPEFRAMAQELSAGLCLAMEVHGDDAVNRLRKIAGPRDVDVAQRIRQHTLRAKYGKTIPQNAIHVTDLEEDGRTESEYFFSVLEE